MGCGASTASPPVEADAKKPARADGQQQQQPSRLLVPVIGLEVSGKSAICDSVCEQLRADGRHCARLDVDSLVKAEIVAGTDIGAEIANLIQQGKLVPQATTLRLLQSALRSSPPDGVFLIEDYPKTVAALDTMAEDFGQAPRLALLFGLGEDVAKQRIVEQADEPTALRRMRSFKMVRSPSRTARRGERRVLLGATGLRGREAWVKGQDWGRESWDASAACVRSLRRGPSLPPCRLPPCHLPPCHLPPCAVPLPTLSSRARLARRSNRIRWSRHSKIAACCSASTHRRPSSRQRRRPQRTYGRPSPPRRALPAEGAARRAAAAASGCS